MKKASEYREHALACRELARTSRNAEERAQLQHLAQTWEGLALDRERIIREQAVLDEMELAVAPNSRQAPLKRNAPNAVNFTDTV